MPVSYTHLDVYKRQAYALSSLLSYLLSVLMIHLSQRVVFQMREDVFNHLTELPVRYFDSHQAGCLLYTSYS